MKTNYSPVTRAGKIFFFMGVFLGASAYLLGCGGRGDTANSGDPNAGSGTPYVSSQGGGSAITLELEGSGNEIRVSQQRGFRVTLRDPQGSPISSIRVFCESEKGIAILEPSSGGVAFAHTNSNGVMSGVIGGLLPGSYMLECRAPHGFDLFARVRLRVTGPVPEGFAGFPGAAGGNLGGGAVVAPPVGQDVLITQVLFTTVSTSQPTRTANIDTTRGVCGSGGSTTPEPFAPDNFVMSVANGLPERIFVQSVSIEGGGAAMAEQQLGGLLINANGSTDFTGPFTEVAGASKVYAGTGSPVTAGTHNIKFRLVVKTANGATRTIEQFATIRAYDVDACN